ncbi:sugar ABC transporter permease [Paenibacillus sp. FSL H7-0331]|jgi:putative aldouronate transport system permease protein|uniref:ABC transporter permease n=1 Tax=Paenibacillus sp. FSL H7-0331 TaxID=1920421 RepID=UPI00096FF873|nr:ABC transporter permease subunit [Paenibacillus sp. FSL H7-0331]OMF16044.1 sugar ABC transporter permease [Paenibacillus sp. FSL H7-0331]
MQSTTVKPAARAMSAARRDYRIRLRQMRHDYQLYVIILLPVAWLILFHYVPMFGLQLAFKNFRITDGIWGSPWAGLGYFEKFFYSYQFTKIVGNTLIISFYELLAGFPLPIVLALALNATLRTKFKQTVQFVTYMPFFISTVVMVGMILQFLNPRVGIVNTGIGLFGMDAINFMGDPNWFKSIYVWSGIWQTTGWGTIIYLAALSGISPEIHEAATIDGATRLQRIRHVDIPGILPTIVTLLILHAGSIMGIGFEKIYLMQNPLNISSSEVISTYVYSVSLASSAPNYSYATAIGLFNSVVNMIIILTVNQIAKKVGQTSLW